MQNEDTRGRIAQRCLGEALAVQDMLGNAVEPPNLLERIADRLRTAIRRKPFLDSPSPNMTQATDRLDVLNITSGRRTSH